MEGDYLFQDVVGEAELKTLLEVLDVVKCLEHNGIVSKAFYVEVLEVVDMLESYSSFDPDCRPIEQLVDFRGWRQKGRRVRRDGLS